jgi:hypothetical protein
MTVRTVAVMDGSDAAVLARRALTRRFCFGVSARPPDPSQDPSPRLRRFSSSSSSPSASV